MLSLALLPSPRASKVEVARLTDPARSVALLLVVLLPKCTYTHTIVSHLGAVYIPPRRNCVGSGRRVYNVLHLTPLVTLSIDMDLDPCSHTRIALPYPGQRGL
jgi:hypothetical protein